MLLSIDPGVNNCGIAVVDYTERFNVIEVFNVCNARKFTPTEKLTETQFGTRVVKVGNILDKVSECLQRNKAIDHVTIESPFYNALTPVAYGSLLEVISAVKYNLLVPSGIVFSMAEPLVVKKMFIGCKITRGMTGKEVMRIYMQKRVDSGEIHIPKPVEDMTEHEIDAIAIAYVKVMRILEEKQNVN